MSSAKSTTVLNEKAVEKHYDFMKEKKWLFVIGGYGDSRSALYIIYLTFIMSVFVFPGIMAIWGACEVFPDKGLVIDALHVVLNSTFGIWGLVTRIFTDKSLKETRRIINSGFYHYNDEEMNEEEAKMKLGVVESIKRKLNTFLFIFITGSVLSTLCFPISQMYLVTDEEYEMSVDIRNPYLPHFFHLPFSTRPASGLAAAFILILFFHYYVYGTAAIMYVVTISCAMQLENQLQILNHSIRNIQERALIMYRKKFKIDENSFSVDDLYKDQEFQKCAYNCLRSNIVHHQLLRSFNEEMQPFNGSSFLLLVVVASISVAALLSLILENPPVNFLIVFLSMLLSEQVYTIYICSFGERIMEESGKLFESLYAVHWFYYNKRFNRLLNVFMCYTRKPMRLRALCLDITASLETYGNFMSAMYKLLNILREKDEL